MERRYWDGMLYLEWKINYEAEKVDYLERYLCKKNEIETKIMAETKADMGSWKGLIQEDSDKLLYT